MSNNKGMNIVLWGAQVILAGMFAMAGIMKSTQPIAQLVPTLSWADQMPELLVRFIGISEVSGALGLLLPSVFRIKPQLTAFAALGLATVMVFAIVFHISRGELSVIGFNLVLGTVALFIAWGRLKKAPIQAK